MCLKSDTTKYSANTILIRLERCRSGGFYVSNYFLFNYFNYSLNGLKAAPIVTSPAHVSLSSESCRTGSWLSAPSKL